MTQGRTAHVAWRAHAPLDRPGTPVLLLHGLTDSGACWVGVVEHLASADGVGPVLTLDARGHGESDLPDELFSLRALGADAVAVLREVIGRPTLVVGHSMGALTAQEVALQAPDLVVGVVLEDPPWPPSGTTTPRGFPAWLPGAVRDAQREPYDVLVARSRVDNPRWADDDHETCTAATRQVDPRLVEVAHDWDPRDWVESLADVAVPVTLVTGDPARGAIVDATHVERAHEILGGAPDGRLTHVHVPEAGHSVRRDDRAAFLRALDDVVGQSLPLG